MIFDFITTVLHLVNGGVQAAHSQIFEENVAIAAASDSHFVQQLKAAYHAAHVGEVKFRCHTGVGVSFFSQQRLASARCGKLERPRSLVSVESKLSIAKAH